MSTHLTNEHSQLYPAVNEENDPPQRIINNIEIPQGDAIMYWIYYILGNKHVLLYYDSVSNSPYKT